MSGNEYNTAGDTGSGGGGFRTDCCFCLHVQSASFFPTFIEKQNKNNNKKSRVLRDEYFPSLLIEKKTRAFLPTFRAEKEICGLFGTDIVFKVTRIYFFIENIRHMIKKPVSRRRYKALYSSSSY